MISHENLFENSKLIASACRTSVSSSAIIWLPFYHDMGLIGGVLQSMYANTSAQLMSPVSFIQHPFRWLKLMSDSRATIAVAANFAFELCCDKVTDEQLQTLDLSSLQCVLCGAEPVNANTVQRFCKTFARCGFKYEAFMPSYGLAEATLYVSGTLHDGTGPTVLSLDTAALSENQIEFSLDDKHHSEQKLISNGEIGELVRIVDPETHKALGEKQVGEIWLSGKSIARGYWNRDRLNHEVFGVTIMGDSKKTPYYRTGDLGFSQGGQLFVNGRINDLLFVNGKNYYPHNIEYSVTCCHERLITGAAAAFTVDQGAGQQLVVIAELSRQAVRELKDIKKSMALIEVINHTLACDHGILPLAVCLVKPTAVLKTTSAKVRRAANKKHWLSGGVDAVYEWRSSVPQNSTDKVLK